MKKLPKIRLLTITFLLIIAVVSQSCNVFAEDPLQISKYDFVYEREARDARMELNNKIGLLANNELDPLINKAIGVWRQDGDKEKFNKATEATLKSYGIECDKLQKCFEKRMQWAEKNLHANSPEGMMRAKARLVDRSLKSFIRIW